MTVEATRRTIAVMLPLLGEEEAQAAADAVRSGWVAQGPRVARFALDLQLDPAAYRDCVDNDRTAPLILNDVMQASGAGVSGTPAFVIGNRIIPGAVPYADLAREIDTALAAPPPAPGAAPAPPPAPPAP